MPEHLAAAQAINEAGREVSRRFLERVFDAARDDPQAVADGVTPFAVLYMQHRSEPKLSRSFAVPVTEGASKAYDQAKAAGYLNGLYHAFPRMMTVDKQPARSKRGEGADTYQATVLVADFDAKDGATYGAVLAWLAALKGIGIVATYLVASGTPPELVGTEQGRCQSTGWHVYVFLAEPITGNALVRRFATRFQVTAIRLAEQVGALGLDDQCSADVARCMRLPGTANWKPERDGPPLAAWVIASNEGAPMLSASDLDDILDDMPERPVTPAAATTTDIDPNDKRPLSLWSLDNPVLKIAVEMMGGRIIGTTSNGEVMIARPGKEGGGESARYYPTGPHGAHIAFRSTTWVGTPTSMFPHVKLSDVPDEDSQTGRGVTYRDATSYRLWRDACFEGDQNKAAAAARALGYQPEPAEVGDYDGPFPDADEVLAAGLTGDHIAYSDLGNARILARLHGHRARYVNNVGWHVYDGARWKLDPHGGIILAKQTVPELYRRAAAETDDEDRKRAVRHAVGSEQKGRLVAMEELARSEGLQAEADDFDRDGNLLGTPNGTVDLRTGERRDARPGDFITKTTAVEYDPAATCELWERFILQVMGDDEDLAAWLKRALGYSITGDVSEQCVFIANGRGSNGKSLILRVVSQVMGGYSQTAPISLWATGDKRGDKVPTDVARLNGARFVTSFELPENGWLPESIIKTLAGGDRIPARFMRQDYFEFDFVGKLWLSTNHLPRIRGTDDGIWRKIRQVPFPRRFLTERECAEQGLSYEHPNVFPKDRKLEERLAGERAGILRWLIEGAAAWYRDGLDDLPATVARATADYRASQDALAAFLDECCVIDPQQWVRKTALFRHYVEWCTTNQEHSGHSRGFSARMVEKGYTSRRSGKSGNEVWQGIGIKGPDIG